MPSTTAHPAPAPARTRPHSRPQTPAPAPLAPVADRAVADPAASGRPAAMHVVGYLRVSSQEQAKSGLGIAAQRQRIEEEAARRGWTVTWCVDDGYSAASLARPGVSAAFDLLKSGAAQGLVVAKLDRLSRSLIDFSSVMEDARRQRWAVVALDLGVDTTTPAGELVANVMAAVAQWERRAIQQRTKDALAAAKARGQRLGRPRATPPDVVARVVALSAEYSPLQVARALTAECVPTTRSAPAWRASTVRRVLQGVALDAEAAAARAAVAAR